MLRSLHHLIKKNFLSDNSNVAIINKLQQPFHAINILRICFCSLSNSFTDLYSFPAKPYLLEEMVIGLYSGNGELAGDKLYIWKYYRSASCISGNIISQHHGNICYRYLLYI